MLKQRRILMSDHDLHVRVVDEKVTALSKALADLGRGTSLRELLKIIRFPGYTTPAEFALTVAIVDAMAAHASVLAKLENDLLAGSKQIVEQARATAV
jgi:predicted lipoprotein